MFESSLRMRWIQILRPPRLPLRRSTVVYVCVRRAQLVHISMFDFLHSPSSVQLLADHFIRLHELVYLPGKLVILSTDHMDMIVHRIYFILHGRVVLM